jgi:hypothetical protein
MHSTRDGRLRCRRHTSIARAASRNPTLDGCVRDALDQGWASTVPQAYQYCSHMLSIPTPNPPPPRRSSPQYAMGAYNNPHCFGAQNHVYGAHPGAGFSHSRAAFGAQNHVYGAHPGAGFSHSRAAFGARVPEGVMLATAKTRPSPGRQLPPTLDACIEVIRNSNAVRVIFKNGEVWEPEMGWVLSGNKYTVDGQVHHEIIDSTGAIEGYPNPHIVPLCLIEGTFRPVGTSSTTPTTPARPDILAACLEFIPMGNGAFRVVFENGEVWEPEMGWVLSGNKSNIDGVIHFEIINSIGAIEGQPNPKLIPLCIREAAPEPVTVLVPTQPVIPTPPPAVFSPAPTPTRPPAVFSPAPTPTRPPAVFSPAPIPTRPSPTPTRPDPRLPIPTPPGTFTPPPQGPTAPTPVPVGPCEPCDEYGNVSFIQVPGGSMGPRCG